MNKKSIAVCAILVLLVSCFAAFAQEVPKAAKNAGFVSGKNKKIAKFSAKTLSGEHISEATFAKSDAIIFVYSAAQDKNATGLQTAAALAKQYPVYVISADASAKLTKPIKSQGISPKTVVPLAKSFISALGNPGSPSWIIVRNGSIRALKPGTIDKESMQSAAAAMLREGIRAIADGRGSNSSTGSSGTASDTTQSGTTENSIPLNPGVADASFATALELEVLRELNYARTRPAEYAQFLREYASYVNGTTYTAPGRIPYLLNEGLPAVEEAIAALENQTPVGALSLSRGMSLAALDHVQDLGPNAGTGHTGSDGSDPFERMSRYGTVEGYCGENARYANDTSGRDIVVSLIIDDGVPSRGHRNNIFSPYYKVLGVACGEHSRYGNMCVQDFAEGYQEGSN